MGVSNFDELREHIGHKVRVVGYGTVEPYDIWNTAVECEDCGCVLFDYDRYEEPTKYIPTEDFIPILEIARIGLIMAATPVGYEMDISNEEIERLKKVLDDYLEK